MSKVISKFAFAMVMALAMTAGGSQNTQAAVITGLFNTGVDAFGNALAGGDGVTDTHYVITTSDIANAIVGDNAVTYLHPSYVPDSSTSRWVSNSADGQPGNGTVTFQTTFNVAGSGPVAISGFWGVDNIGEIFLNGVDTGIGLPFGFPAFEILHAFSITSGFVTGLNTLDFVIQDTGPPLAFRVESLTSAVPELSTWAMMLLGFAGLGFAAYRRSQRVAALNI